jgi:transglutaminase-like putative cysteine protease
MRKHILVAAVLVAFLLLTALSCMTRAELHSTPLYQTDEKTITVGRTYEKVLHYQYEIKDFEPVVTKVEKLDLKPTQSDQTTEYHSKMTNALFLMREKKFQEAIEALKPLCAQFKDDGLALYNLGVCYLNLKDWDNARLYFANSYAAGFSEAFRAIDNLNAMLAYSYFEEKNYPDAIRWFKTAPADERVSMDVICCYMEIAKTFPTPKNLIPLLYAGNYIVDNGVLDKNILALGAEIGKQLGDSPVEAYLPNAIAVLEYLARETSDPWMNINLGLLYAHDNRPELALAQYRLAAERAGSNRDLYRFASGRLVEMGEADYRYRKDIPFTVDFKGGDPARAGLDATFTVPQNAYGQTVSGLAVLLNGKPVDFTPVKDRYRAEFVSVKLSGVLKPGENALTVQARVVRSARRFTAQDLASFTAASYDKRSPLYRLYTESTKIYNLSHPLVKKAAADVRARLKKNDVASIVKAVYDYAIEKLRYELYDNENRPKEEILDRLQKTNGVGLCEDYAVFTASVLRSLGIPALVISGPTYNADIGHAWPAVFTPKFDTPIVADTTWADTGEMPNYYFLFNTNQNVVEGVGWDSDVLPGAMALTYRRSAGLEVVFGKEKETITM